MATILAGIHTLQQHLSHLNMAAMADSHYKCCSLVSLLRGMLTRPIESEGGIFISTKEQAGLDEVLGLLEDTLADCEPYLK